MQKKLRSAPYRFLIRMDGLKMTRDPHCAACSSYCSLRLSGTRQNARGGRLSNDNFIDIEEHLSYSVHYIEYYGQSNTTLNP